MGIYMLGRCYDRGRGVPVDEKRALKWYRKATDKETLRVRTSADSSFRWEGEVREGRRDGATYFESASDRGKRNATNELENC